MSSKSVINTVCPICGKIHRDAEIYSSISYLLDSDKIKDLLSNNLNKVTCGGCGDSFIIRSNLLINIPNPKDYKRAIFISYVPISESERTINNETVLNDFLSRNLIDSYKYDDWNEFLEKVEDIWVALGNKPVSRKTENFKYDIDSEGKDTVTISRVKFSYNSFNQVLFLDTLVTDSLDLQEYADNFISSLVSNKHISEHEARDCCVDAEVSIYETDESFDFRNLSLKEVDAIIKQKWKLIKSFDSYATVYY